MVTAQKQIVNKKIKKISIFYHKPKTVQINAHKKTQQKILRIDTMH